MPTGCGWFRRGRGYALRLAPVLLLTILLMSAATAASGAGPEHLLVGDHEAEVTAASPTDLIISVDGEVWTYRRYPGGSSLAASAVARTDPQLINAIVTEWERLHPEWVNPPQRSPWQFLGGLAVMGLGVAEAWHPRFFWYLSDGWKFRNAEPSDLALGLERLGGVITIVVGLVILFH